jgi:hypothetical protein
MIKRSQDDDFFFPIDRLINLAYLRFDEKKYQETIRGKRQQLQRFE